MELMVERDMIGDSTEGQFFVDDQFVCYTLEDRFREDINKPVTAWKVAGDTAIPEGRYIVQLTFSPRFQMVLPILLDVPGFSDIRIHSGNTAADTEGCILVGLDREDGMITNSHAALLKLLPLLEHATDAIYITVG